MTIISERNFSKPAASNPRLSVAWFLKEMEQYLGNRDWRVAYHPYPPDLLQPEFSALDFPKVTYGNIGMVVGFLHAEFPNDPLCLGCATDRKQGEFGGASFFPVSAGGGRLRFLPNGFGDSGISNYVYHRMKDHPVETDAGLGCGWPMKTGL